MIEKEFKRSLKKEPDDDYIRALLILAKAFSKDWVIDAILEEKNRREGK